MEGRIEALVESVGDWHYLLGTGIKPMAFYIYFYL